jgi:hypothetical protein
VRVDDLGRRDAMRRGTPQPGWLFAGALVALFGAVALVGVLAAWWLL